MPPSPSPATGAIVRPDGGGEDGGQPASDPTGDGSDTDEDGGDAHPLGVLALLGAAALHALVHVLLERDAGAISPLTLNALPMGLAGLLLCTAGVALEHPDPWRVTGAARGRPDRLAGRRDRPPGNRRTTGGDAPTFVRAP